MGYMSYKRNGEESSVEICEALTNAKRLLIWKKKMQATGC